MGRERVLFASFVLAAWAAGSVLAKTGALSIEDKIAIENSLENKLRSVLVEILGTQRVIVSVNLELLSTEEIKQKPKKQSEFILPGVPSRGIGSADTQQPILNLGEAATKIKSMSVTIVLDAATSSSDVDLARKVAGSILGINTARGDVLLVDTMAFRKAGDSFEWRQMLRPPDLWFLCGMTLLVFLVMVLFWSLPRLTLPLAASVRDLAARMQALAASREREEENPEPSLPQNAPAALQQEKEDAKSVDGEPAPFEFLKPAHFNALRFLLTKEKPEDAAIVLHYAPPWLSAQLMEFLAADVRAQVLRRLASPQEEDPEHVRQVENRFKSKIQYLVGGEEKIGALLDEADSELRHALLSSLQARHPELASKLRNELVFVEDMRFLERPGLQLLMRRVPMAVIARVLKQWGANGTDSILVKLPEGVAERLRQEMDLARSVTAQQLKADQRMILDALRTLRQEGHLKKGERESERWKDEQWSKGAAEGSLEQSPGVIERLAEEGKQAEAEAKPAPGEVSAADLLAELEAGLKQAGSGGA